MLEESQCFESQGVVHLSTGGVQAEKERGKVGKKKEKEGERKRGDGNKREVVIGVVFWLMETCGHTDGTQSTSSHHSTSPGT